MRQTSTPIQYVNLSVRVTPEVAKALKVIADAEFRPVAAEIRRLIEERVAQGVKEAA